MVLAAGLQANFFFVTWGRRFESRHFDFGTTTWNEYHLRSAVEIVRPASRRWTPSTGANQLAVPKRSSSWLTESQPR